MNKKVVLFFLMLGLCAGLYAAEPEVPRELPAGAVSVERASTTEESRELPEGAVSVQGPRDRLLAQKDATWNAALDALFLFKWTLDSLDSREAAFKKLEMASRVLATWCLKFAYFCESGEVADLKRNLEVSRDTYGGFLANRLWRRALFAMELGAWLKLLKAMPVGENGRVSDFQLQQLLTWHLDQVVSLDSAFAGALERNDFVEAQTNFILFSMIGDFVKMKIMAPFVGGIKTEGRESFSEFCEEGETFSEFCERKFIGMQIEHEKRIIKNREASGAAAASASATPE